MQTEIMLALQASLVKDYSKENQLKQIDMLRMMLEINQDVVVRGISKLEDYQNDITIFPMLCRGLKLVRNGMEPQVIESILLNTALANDVDLLESLTMLHYVGEDGVAAVTIIMYVLMFASSLYTGYSYGVAPMLSYYYGERNQEKLKKMVAVSLKVIAAISVVTVAASFLLTRPLVSVFARPDNPVYDLAVTGNRICTIALFFIGFNIFASGMFTALSNGIVSAVLAFSRSFVFMLITMIVLPLILGVNGIWLATPAAELMAFALSIFMFLKYRK